MKLQTLWKANRILMLIVAIVALEAAIHEQEERSIRLAVLLLFAVANWEAEARSQHD